jgi:GTP cyclohydrolase I
LLVDVAMDHNTRETAKRVARMYVREVFAGRYTPAPSTTDFPNAKHLDQMYTLGPIAVRSACSHHLVPIVGRLWVAVIPGERVIGISKFVRLARWVMSRPHIQEEAAVMLADELESRIAPRGIAVAMQAEHLCMTWRGVQETETQMMTTVLRGEFDNNPVARQEFTQYLNRSST